jgi:hypothetical protein
MEPVERQHPRTRRATAGSSRPAVLLGSAALALAVLAGLAFAAFWIQVRSFADEATIELRERPRLVGSTARVALLGDSWATEELAKLVREEIQQRGWQVELVRARHPGARSRVVYEDLLRPADEPYSSQALLLGEPVHAAVVIVGVNDSSAYIGSDFYTHHVGLIVRALQQRGVFPFVLELPEFGIEVVESRNPIGYTRRHLMRQVYEGGERDVIPAYRQALRTALQPALEADELRLIPFDAVSNDYQANLSLYKDAAHLNDAGNRRLAAQIAESVVAWLASRTEAPTAGSGPPAEG